MTSESQPYQPGQPIPAQAVVGQRNKVIGIVLALLFGEFGVHNFYLGFTKKAGIQLTLGIIGMVTTLIAVGFFILAGVFVWAVVDAVQIYRGAGTYANGDANGIPLQ